MYYYYYIILSACNTNDIFFLMRKSMAIKTSKLKIILLHIFHLCIILEKAINSKPHISVHIFATFEGTHLKMKMIRRLTKHKALKRIHVLSFNMI